MASKGVHSKRIWCKYFISHSFLTYFLGYEFTLKGLQAAILYFFSHAVIDYSYLTAMTLGVARCQAVSLTEEFKAGNAAVWVLRLERERRATAGPLSFFYICSNPGFGLRVPKPGF